MNESFGSGKPIEEMTEEEQMAELDATPGFGQFSPSPCPRCGLAVADPEKHFEWHIEQAPNPRELELTLRAYGRVKE